MISDHSAIRHCACSRRIAKASGAIVVTTLADMEGNETFDPLTLGSAEEVRFTSCIV